MESIFPDVTNSNEQDEEEGIKRLDTLAQVAGRSENFYQEIRIDVLEQLFDKVLVDIQLAKDHDFKEKINSIKIMKEHRFETEAMYEEMNNEKLK